MKSRFPPSPGAPTDQFLHLCFTGCAMFYCSGPQPFWPQEPISWKTIFPWTAGGGGGGGGFRMIQATLCSLCPLFLKGFPGGSDGEESACNAGDPGSIPGSGRSPGEGNG